MYEIGVVDISVSKFPDSKDIPLGVKFLSDRYVVQFILQNCD
jgi:hypothetical protein